MRGVEIVLKVGGSLERSRALPRVLKRLARLARRRRLVVVPGGGRFADRVREAQARFGLDDETAHRMALRAMDQYGLLLADLCEEARAVRALAPARALAAAGGVPVLLVASELENDAALERSFRLTSDAIAAIIARRLGARRLVLLKSCACPPGPVRSRGDLRLLARRGAIDPLFPTLAPGGCEVRLVNARRAAAWDRGLSRGGRLPLR